MIDYQLLPKSYKGAFPFKIGTTSFIYPDDYVPNVRMVGPYVDEIELLFLESRTENLPTKKIIQELSILSSDLNVSYNIHLPSDIYPGSADPLKQKHTVDTLKTVFELTRPLCPTTYTLHLPMEDNMNQKEWLGNIHGCLKQLIEKVVPGEKVSVETLSYPIEWAAPLIKELHLSVCIDVGHLIIFGHDVSVTIKTWRDQTTIVHLHGVDGKKDHISLDRMKPSLRDAVMSLLSQFKGVVSLEVFSFEHLSHSLECLETYRGDINAACGG